MEEEAILLAGGLGTRLQPAITGIPKCMAPVNGKPFLHYLLEYLDQQGIRRIILSVGYLHETIMDWCHKNITGFDIQFAVEQQPLGTGGAIRYALQYAKNDHVFVLNGDTFFPVNLQQMRSFHEQQSSSLTIALKCMQHFDRYGSVLLNEEKRIIAFKEKQYLDEGLINGGIYRLCKKDFLSASLAGPFSFEKEYLEIKVAEQYFTGWIADEYFIDIGIPEDYARAQHELRQQVKKQGK